MYISKETPAQTDQRLRAVIKLSRVKIFESYYVFSELSLNDFPSKVNKDALAIVRDDQVWSQLIPSVVGNEESFGIFRFHFPEGKDNSGFVGWLASHLKKKFGTGVFVTCGNNKSDGGIFDYWGCPVALAHDVFEEIYKLTRQ